MKADTPRNMTMVVVALGHALHLSETRTSLDILDMPNRPNNTTMAATTMITIIITMMATARIMAGSTRIKAMDGVILQTKGIHPTINSGPGMAEVRDRRQWDRGALLHDQ